MKEREELELILNLMRKYSLPLSPILEYAIKEKMEEYPETNTTDYEEESLTESYSNEVVVEPSNQQSYKDEQSTMRLGYSLQNHGNHCSIIDALGEKVFSSSGKLTIIEGDFYRVSYTYSFISMNLVKKDDRGLYVLGKRILNAHHSSPLYSSLDKHKYLDQINDVKIDYNTEEYHIQVGNRWYGSSGYYADLEEKRTPCKHVDNEKVMSTPQNVSEYNHEQARNATSDLAEKAEDATENYSIENHFANCSIYNRKKEEVFLDKGKLKFLNDKLYRFNLKEQCFTVKRMQLNNGKWTKGSKLIVAYPETELYSIIDYSFNYVDEINDIIDDELYEECKIKVRNTWYDNEGIKIDDSKEEKDEVTNKEVIVGNTDETKNIVNDFSTVDNNTSSNDDTSNNTFSDMVGKRIRLLPSQKVGTVVRTRIDKSGGNKLVVQTDEGELVETSDSIYYFELLKSVKVKRARIPQKDTTNYKSSLSGPKLSIGKWIIWKPTGAVGKIDGFIYKGSVRKIILQLKNGDKIEVYDNPKAYEIMF